MRTESGSGCRRIRLYGISLVQQSLAVDILKQVPQSLYIPVVICNIRVVHIHPISDTLGQVHPFTRIFHHLLAAGPVVVLYAYAGTYVLFGYAEHLFYAELDRKAMCIPPCTPFYTIAALGLVSADRILYGPRHHMVDTWHSVGGRRTFKENKFRSSFPDFQRTLEGMVLLPPVKNLVPDLHQVQSLILFKSHI